MKRVLSASLLLAAVSALAAETPLTLEAALSTADAAHPVMQAARADLDLALADEKVAGSVNDATLAAEAILRRGRPTVGDDDWLDDNVGRLVLRKTLLDFGRESGQVAAARQEVNARQLALMDTRDARRIDIMARFFDVLLADARYGAENEFMAVHYVRWDDSKKRHELGEMSDSQLAELEVRFQDARERRNRSLMAQRATRQRLANALNQPGRLPSVLALPQLGHNDLSLPTYEDLLPLALESNRKLLALQAQLNAVASRSDAIRASRAPTLDVEVIAGDYSRDTSTRDRLSGGLVLNWPLYQGERVDSRLARQVAERTRLEAQVEQARRELSEGLLETLQEIEWLRSSARPAARAQIDYRDKALDRARAEYELEMRTNLGETMAETQQAAIRASEAEYRLALALARLEALVGQALTAFATQTKLTEN
ncbi:TolC family protein [Betaproteobacteria bacterium SCN2]|jgi:outer membrane protein TolC|nr:TolC family protein [Betaproteobacteria bacterium SCN2]